MVTPEIRLFRENASFRTEFMDFLYADTAVEAAKNGTTDSVSSSHDVKFADIFKLVSEFRHGTTVKDICLRNRPKRTLGIDMFRLVQYLVLKGVIRRLHKYPVHMRYEVMAKERAAGNSNEDKMYLMFNGKHHLDEICIKCQLSNAEVMEKIENDPDVLCLTR